MVYERYYIDGLLDGPETTWDNDGDLSFIMEYKKGKPDGLLQDFYNSGAKRSEQMFSNGETTGPRHYWDEAGKPLHGHVAVKYPVGNRIRSECDFINGILHGKEICYYGNGKKNCEVFYVHGFLHGEMRIWDKSGNLICLSKYESGKIQGWDQGWFSDGSIEFKTFYIDGKRCGLSMRRDSPGESLDISYYVDNRLVTKQQYLEARVKNPALPPVVDEEELQKEGNKAPMANNQ